jgi:polyribonucleotide nucleotidyltransferase
MPKHDDHYAILLAITRYPGLPLNSLGGPENDAEDFRQWLLDEAGGNLDEKRIEIITSSKFPPLKEPEEPYDANPAETQLKKVLDRWLGRIDEEGNRVWLDRVGKRLYLFFAGHGFTAGSLGDDPALYTAQAQLGDTVHIAALRYASKIRNAGFFDEIVLVVDCCQDVLKASQVLEPTWNPTDRNKSGDVLFMEAYAAPRGKKSREGPKGSGLVRGYFSYVFLQALRNAPADADGYVTARAVADTAHDEWVRGGYIKLTDVKEPPIRGPRNMRLYRRRLPPQNSPPGSGLPKTDPNSGPGGPPTGPRSFGPADYDEARQNEQARSELRRPSFVGITISSQDPGALIRVLDAERHEVASQTGRLEAKLQSGQYTARIRAGDGVQDHPFTLSANAQPVKIEQGFLPFSSPIPLENTSTHHEYQYNPAMELGSMAVQRANLSGFPKSVGTLMVFARDSTHKFGNEWSMPVVMREGLRLRKLDEETGEPRVVPCQPVVDAKRGYCSLLLNDLSPGTYLLGVRHQQGDYVSWQEMTLTVASSWWRTEVYLDSIDDDWTGRRFDIESAGVLIVPGKGSGSLYGSEARLTEVARLALFEGRLGVDGRLLPRGDGVHMPGPMMALYTAYALTYSLEPDLKRIRILCNHLQKHWTSHSADVKLLASWCSAKDRRSAQSKEIDLRPDEVPMLARGWELSKQLGSEAQLPLAAQYHLGMWRTSSLLWTQTQVPDMVEVRKIPAESATVPTTFELTPNISPPQVIASLCPPSPMLSPLQQTLRRALIDAAELAGNTGLDTFTDNFSKTSGFSRTIVLSALTGLLKQSSAIKTSPVSDSIAAASEVPPLHPHQVQVEVGGRTLTLEIGKLAKQANGAVMARYGDTIVLTTACMSVTANDRDFLPLTVDYRENTYAAGKIPGSFFKREGRPTEKEVLTSRLIDRPMRPLFPESWRNETQIVSMVLSADSDNDPDVIAVTSASAAAYCSDLPFHTPIAAVRVGLLNGQLAVNPTVAEQQACLMNIVVAGSEEGIVMVESSALEVSEEIVTDALELGHAQIKKIVAGIRELHAQIKPQKVVVAPFPFDEKLYGELEKKYGAKLRDALNTEKHPTKESSHLVDALKAEIVDAIPENDAEKRTLVTRAFQRLREKIFRDGILNARRRPDGRAFDQIRKIICEVGLLPRVHGSALFTRGETQALATLTLGTKEDMQHLDLLFEQDQFKRFSLHYNFLPFSVGEVKFLRGPSRREIGHGALAERALMNLLPAEADFPYAMHLVSDILESNGSSSMATVCGGSLALMDAGVPLKSACAGIAMGLVVGGNNNYSVLTDIAGAEDHYGDVEFKVAGTRTGITALQMDIKVLSITISIPMMREALAQANRARLEILETMDKTLDTHHVEISAYAPRLYKLKIPQDKIRDLIGPGGQKIKSIIEVTGAKIDVLEDGTVLIFSTSGAGGDQALQMVRDATASVEIGKTYLGKVVRLAEFGAFVELFPGTDGLLHISEISEHRIRDVGDELKLGDQILVKVLSIEGNKVRLSRKALIIEARERQSGKQTSEASRRPAASKSSN